MPVNAYKPVGKTPLDVVKKVKKTRPSLKDKKIGYAGRLDPMAEGVLLLLIEPETKNSDIYQKLDKTYEFEILLGMETDTLDALGMIVAQGKTSVKKSDAKKVVSELTGKIELPYPDYSSRTVKGKPLFWWARNNKLDKIVIPMKRSDIHSIELLEIKSIKSADIYSYILKSINSVKGDFRQKKILKNWTEYFMDKQEDDHTVLSARASVSSGTYIRSLAKKIANDLGTFGVALRIKRTRIGSFKLGDSNNFFKQKY